MNRTRTRTMTDTFYVRELDPSHPSLNQIHPPAEESCGKNNTIKMTSTRGGIAEASQPRALREPRVPHRWYRRSVPNCGTTRNHPAPGGWVGAVFLGSPLTHNAPLVPPGVCSAWPLLAVWDLRFSRAHPANPQHTFGPSWSVWRMAAPRSVGPAVFSGSPPTHTSIKLPQHNAEAGSRSSS